MGAELPTTDEPGPDLAYVVHARPVRPCRIPTQPLPLYLVIHWLPEVVTVILYEVSYPGVNECSTEGRGLWDFAARSGGFPEQCIYGPAPNNRA